MKYTGGMKHIENPEVRQWLLTLQDAPENIRIAALGTRVSKMMANRESPELIAEFASLLSPDVFRALVKTLLALKE